VADLTFVGHNTVVVRTPSTRVILDPFLLAGGPKFPPTYQPIPLRDLGPVDAVLITHSHPDHFHPASLLQFPPDTHLIVPRVDRETLLTVALERRLRELGFAHISALDWWQSTRVGDVEVHALPFYGEQPTDGERLHPGIRNAGNTYLVRTPNFSAAFLVDSGRDGQGDVRDVAARARARLGAVDFVFAGYRGWLTYPAQLLFSSVARYLLFVPPALWGVRQQLMNTADDAVDVAERWGARYLVPYADGGAPWYWRIGLGPRLDDEAAETFGFDPFPERVLAAARRRTQSHDGQTLGSPVRPLLLRPGDSVRHAAAEATVLRIPGHAWSYGERPD
jgi:L-ascorbate metabolism protein UlaG (beta-lactamase superfamily)